jgi:hypothetical protein
MAAIITRQLSLSEGKGRKGEAGGSAPYEYPCVLVGTPQERSAPQSLEAANLQERRKGCPARLRDRPLALFTNQNRLQTHSIQNSERHYHGISNPCCHFR